MHLIPRKSSLIQKIIWLLFKMVEWMKITLLILALRLIKARGSNLFVAINDCTCEGHNVTYECTAFGNGATVWNGTAFDCPLTNNELTVFHTINNSFTSQRSLSCNNGAITVHAIEAENGSYKSQITIRVSSELNGTTIVCAHDNGTLSTQIGSAIITIAPFPPPTDVQLIEVNHTSIRFNWSHVSLHCPSLQYHIMADNCGKCSRTTTTNTATCTGDYTHLTSDHPCSFAVRSAVCDGIVGDFSNAVNVPMIGAGTGPNDNSVSSDSYGAVLLRIVITLGAVIGAMLIMIIFITLLFTSMTTILLKSKQALRLELDLLQAKVKEQPVIYEEITQLQDSLKSSSPPIDVGENTAYVSVVCMNACGRIST